ncbi:MULTISPECIES: M42 family metallopeptidase [unclassified Aureimonas]|uniref:M42 family metallopeptidase n=1 Tax=unclassified Aureimonas TaxID=2615206 RepID=UPI0007204FD0|nr:MULTISPECIES: M20/M25/M40 family metallo-hydrolase [unclassified Aureimonas]ALN73693.1 endoglucanase [Aureimonas sp. AU20]
MNIDLLKRLCETPGVPGHEHRVRDLIAAEAKGLFDTIETDVMGNLVCTRKGEGENPERIMLACHMDEIGFLVSHINDKGFINVSPVGGFDPRNLFARRVRVCTPKGDYKGVMMAEGKPIHTVSPEDRKKVPEPTEFFVDLGLGAETKKKVRVGDFVVMDEPFLELGEERIVSKAIDNRIACWLGLEAVRKLVDEKRAHRCELIVAFTVQEEVGLRGAKTVAFARRPHIGIGVDTTLACDTPGVPEKDRTTELGKGAGLHLKDGSFIADVALVEEFEAVAEAGSIPVQRTILAGGGMDGASLQQAASGARAIGIVVGTRYIHTVGEMIDRRDALAARDLLAAFIASH